MSGVEILKEGRFLRLLRKGPWEFVQRTNCTGVVVIAATTESEEVVFVEQYRAPVDARVIELPAGLVSDQGVCETSQAAAERELLEETGFGGATMVEIFSGPGGAGASSDILTFFLARGVRRIAQGGGDATEAITVHSVPLGEVDAWLRAKVAQGMKADPKIYAGLYFLRNYNTISD